MVVGSERIIMPEPERIEQVLIGNVRELERLDGKVRQALFGHLADHLAIVCQERLPNNYDVIRLLKRRLALLDLGVWENVIGRSELTILASQIVSLQRQSVVGASLDETQTRWDQVMKESAKHVPGFRRWDPVSMQTSQEHLRRFLLIIDRSWTRGALVVGKRLPDLNDWERYRQSFEMTEKVGVDPVDIKHLEMIGAAVFIKYYQRRVGGEKSGR